MEDYTQALSRGPEQLREQKRTWALVVCNLTLQQEILPGANVTCFLGMSNRGSGTGRHLCGSARNHWKHLFSAWRQIVLEIKPILHKSLTQVSWSLHLYKWLHLSSA